MNGYKTFAAIVAGTLLAGSAGATLFTDDADNYGGGFLNGSNGGTGFDAWSITSNPGTNGFAGAFIGDSSSGLAGNTGLNTAGSNAFGFFANNDSTSSVDAERDFANGVLQTGDSFSIDIGVNFRDGFRGLNLQDASNSTLFTFLVGDIGGPDYFYKDDANGGVDTSLGLGFENDSIFTLTFTQSTATDLNVRIVRNSTNGGLETPLNSNFTISGVDGFKLFINNDATGGSGDADNMYANNLVLNQAIPEASTVAMFGLATAILFAVRRRRVAD